MLGTFLVRGILRTFPLLISLGLATVAPSFAAETPKAIRIGVATAGGGDPITWGGSPGSVVRENKWLESAFGDTEVQWFFFKGAGPAVNEALSNKQIDFAYLGDLPTIIGVSNGLNTKVLLASGQRTNLYLATPKDSDISNIQDLKDRKVAIFKGTNGHLVANNLLLDNGIKESDLRSINLDTGSAQAALVSGSIDAAFGGFEYIRLLNDGLIAVPYSTHGKDPKFTRQTSLVGREDFITDHPDLTQKVVNEFVRASHWASQEENRDALLRIWAKSGTPYESFVVEFEGTPLAQRNSPLLDEFFRTRYQVVADGAKDLQFIRRPVNVEQIFDDRFLQQALQEQQLTDFWVAYDADGVTPSAKSTP